MVVGFFVWFISSSYLFFYLFVVFFSLTIVLILLGLEIHAPSQKILLLFLAFIPMLDFGKNIPIVQAD